MKRTLSAALLALISFGAIAQTNGRVAQGIAALRDHGVEFPARVLFQDAPRTAATEQRWNLACTEATTLLLDASAVENLLVQRPSYFSLQLPTPEGAMVLDLEYVEITTPDFSVVQASTGTGTTYTGGAHYRGMVRGVAGSLAAISIFEDEVMGLVSDGEGERVLGRLADGTDGMHIFYREADLRTAHSASCGTLDAGAPYDPSVLAMQGAPKTVKCVRFYWEVNYDIFQGKGSVANAANYVTGLFNQSAVLYANDGISVLLSQVFVWDVASPYTQTDTGDLLDQFGVTRTSFNGDLAHLLGYAGGGGIAWLNTLCSGSTSLRMAYSDINSTYQNVPTYSWSVEVVTHEQGHNMGSRHTHACAWNGNNTAIDGCGPAAGYTEGSCAQGPLPTSTVGGTIMSYCHLTSSTIKFANGFGPQPAAVIVNAVNNASCLTNCAVSCAAPSGLSSSTVTTSSALLSWGAVTGATSYSLQWKPSTSSTWTTVTGLTSPSYSLTGLSAGTAYSYQVMTVCASGSSAYSTTASFTTSSAACGVPTTLAATNLSSSGAGLSWSPVSGAVSYTLQWRASSAGSWTTVTGLTTPSYTLSGLAAATSYTFQVMTVCSGASSSYSSSATFNTAAASCTDAYEPNGTQATATQLVPTTTVTALINSSTDIDWYTFANSTAQRNIRVRLTNLPANYELTLYRKGTLLVNSTNTGTTSEVTILNNAPVNSAYRIRVKGANTSAFNATQCYTLIVETSATAFAMPEGTLEHAGDDFDGEGEVFSVYPNPASEVVSISLPAHEQAGTLELLDALGRVLRTERMGPSDAPVLQELNVTDRTEGLYLVRFSVDGRSSVQRLIITR